MRNCIDLAGQRLQPCWWPGWADQALWQMPVFGSEEAIRRETQNSPNQVEPEINANFRSA